MSKRPAAPALVHVTDHAVVRYLQRVEIYDIDLVREVIRGRVERGFITAQSIGVDTCAVVMPEAIYQIEDGCVVTVVEPSRRMGKRWCLIGGDES